MINDQNRKWWILAAMSGVLGLIVLDEAVVGVASSVEAALCIMAIGVADTYLSNGNYI